jgi:hypothetical protein
VKTSLVKRKRREASLVKRDAQDGFDLGASIAKYERRDTRDE